MRYGLLLNFLAAVFLFAVVSPPSVADRKPSLSAAVSTTDYVRDDPLTSPRTQWFREAKFGMFIHWGLYAVPAGEYEGRKVSDGGEWIMYNAKIPKAEYEEFAKQFNPVKFNARDWVRVAKDAGMKYIVVTSKHHDGFSMYDTDVNSYNIVDATPFKRDPMRELARACRRAGIKFGVYYSIMDWHHPDANKANAPKYIVQMKAQLRELITKYDPSLLWFDGGRVDWWNEDMGKDLEAYVRMLKPGLVINNRVGRRQPTDGDYDTPEQEIPTAAPEARLWETRMTLNNTWGFKREDQNWKSPGDVIRKLSSVAGKGGNLLLNVGPDAQGVIPPASAKVLEEVGKWLKANGKAVYGTTATPLRLPGWGSITRHGNRLYLIVWNWPKAGQPLRLLLPNPVRKAALLQGGAAVEFRVAGDGNLDLFLPATAPNPHASVVTVDFEGELIGTKRSTIRFTTVHTQKQPAL